MNVFTVGSLVKARGREWVVQPEQKALDAESDEKLWARGIESLRFHHKADWTQVFSERTDIFGSGSWV